MEVQKCAKILCILWAYIHLSVGKRFTLYQCKHGGHRIRLQVVPQRNSMEVECTGLTEADTLSWIIGPLSQDNGYDHGECGPCHDAPCATCTSDDAVVSIVKNVTRKHNELTLTISDTAESIYDADVTCVVNTENWSSCQIKGPTNYTVRGCDNGVLDMDRVSDSSTVTCEGLDPDDYLYWDITTTDGRRDTRTCTQCGQCPKNCNLKDTLYTIMRYNRYSELTFKTSQEAANKTVQCRTPHSEKKGSCKIRVVYRGTLRNASVKLHQQNLIGTANFMNVFASDNDVTCTWTIKHNKEIVRYVHIRPPLIPQISGSINEPVYSGQCTLDISLGELPVSEGQYNISVALSPGNGPLDAGFVNLTQPGSLILDNATCPDIVTEGNDLRCRCHHPPTQRGSPHAVVAWVDRPEKQDVLEIAPVTRDMNGTVYTCRSSWVVSEDISDDQTYTLIVAYADTGSDKTTGNLVIVIVAVGVGLGVIVIIIVVVVGIRKRKLWQEHVSGDDLQNPGRHEMLASHNIDTNVGARLDTSARGVYEIMDNPARGVYEIMDNPDTSSSWELAESGVDGQPSGRPPQAIGQPTEEISDGYEIPVSPHGQQGTNTTGAQNTPSVTVTSSSRTGDCPHGNYASLQMSDVGLPSVYTCLADPDYYNTGAAGVTGPDAETSPVYEN